MVRKFRNSYLLLAVITLFAGCSKEAPTQVEGTTFEALRDAAKSEVKKKNTLGAIAYLEKMMEEYPEHRDIYEYRLKLGDLHFDIQNYEAADVCYKKYRQINPANGEYASYRSILSKFYQTLSVDRDPTSIHKTISRCHRHLDNTHYKFGMYADKVRDIMYTCERKLIDREVYVFNFYLRRGKYKSAQARLDYLKTTFLSKNKDIEDKLLYLESKLAHRQNNVEEAKKIKKVLATKFPNSTYTEMAERMIKGNKFLFT